MSADRRRHVALFVRSFAGGGGAERVMLNLAVGLADSGNRVDLVMARRKGRFLGEIPSSRVRVIDLKAPKAIFAVPSLARIPEARRAMSGLVRGGARVIGSVPSFARYLRRERPDVVISALNYTNIAALLARRLAGTGTPTVVTVHNHLSTAVANSDAPRGRAVPELARVFYPEASAIVAVSNGVADDLAHTLAIPKDRISTIYNPVITPDLMDPARVAGSHPWLTGEPGQDPVILAAGKLKPQKDFPTLLRAVARLRKEHEVRLIVLGDGPDQLELEALARALGIADAVDFAGFVGNPFYFMQRASCFALSSAWEGFGNVLVEAMACGCPVVSTDCPSGPSEILEAGRYGPLVRVGDAEAMAGEIGRILDRPPDTAAMRDRARVFSDAASTAGYEALFDRITAPGQDWNSRTA